MKRSVILLLILIVFAGVNKYSHAQNVLDGIYVKENVPARKPVPYYFLREADVMWSKRIWRMIDLREKINNPLMFPTVSYENQPLNDRYSLICLLLYGIQKEGLVVYDPDADDQFSLPLAAGDIDSRLGASIDTFMVEDPITFELKPSIQKSERRVEEVRRLLLKEEWFFNKQRSKMEVRIIGLCPIRTFYREDDVDQENLTMKQVMWVYYPSVRHLFANHEVFNPFNDAERRTFEDIFFNRRFNSYIFQETNIFNNRRIGSYKYGLDAMLESNKVRDFMFKVEHDLWEF